MKIQFINVAGLVIAISLSACSNISHEQYEPAGKIHFPDNRQFVCVQVLSDDNYLIGSHKTDRLDLSLLLSLAESNEDKVARKEFFTKHAFLDCISDRKQISMTPIVISFEQDITGELFNKIVETLIDNDENALFLDVYIYHDSCLLPFPIVFDMSPESLMLYEREFYLGIVHVLSFSTTHQARFVSGCYIIDGKSVRHDSPWAQVQPIEEFIDSRTKQYTISDLLYDDCKIEIDRRSLRQYIIPLLVPNNASIDSILSTALQFHKNKLPYYWGQPIKGQSLDPPPIQKMTQEPVLELEGEQE